MNLNKSERTAVAAVLELHCGLTRLRLVDGARGALDMLHPYPEDVFDPVHWAKGGIYPLISYSNRVANFRHHTEAAVGYTARDIWPTDAAFLPLGFARPLQDNERADPPRRLVDGTMTASPSTRC